MVKQVVWQATTARFIPSTMLFTSLLGLIHIFRYVEQSIGHIDINRREEGSSLKGRGADLPTEMARPMTDLPYAAPRSPTFGPQ
jgi:hypothetical protein